MKQIIIKTKYYLVGFIAGLLNGFFGAGGGLLVVPMLQALEVEPRKAHATSIAIILPLSILSTVIYFMKGIRFDPASFLTITSAGIVGAIAGSFLLMRLKNRWLRKIFAIIMIVSAIRILMK
ncbi:sulfite exporter TauE/SafE family protein [Paludicola sp. MB14-C6]|uniref:sulfite exporter TauE/SafE family protein n=1 Tax=Paludihabitans sp. MB14-C6 TaxID=3070656 RepID=UPI0027DC4049|nr:sulfite exporter TauE/SafE family protein [Paludicola sp. MB14-C6]WMJ23792.1 sulfite exporter TauE/SafE family protein [Paludicola sp. MB14-C6]